MCIRDRVEGAADPAELTFAAGDVLERTADQGDLFAPVVELKQPLPEL